MRWYKVTLIRNGQKLPPLRVKASDADAARRFVAEEFYGDHPGEDRWECKPRPGELRVHR